MRNWSLALLSLAALAVVACEQKQAEPAARQPTSDKPLTQMDTAPPPAADPYANDPYASEPYGRDSMSRPQDSGTTAGRAPAKKSSESVLIGSGKTSRTHVVQQGDTLYALARRYYNDPKRWRDIYDANRGTITDKDRLSVGTKLVIP